MLLRAWGREPTVNGECQKDLFLNAFPAGSAGQPHARIENYEGGLPDCLSLPLARLLHSVPECVPAYV